MVSGYGDWDVTPERKGCAWPRNDGAGMPDLAAALAGAKGLERFEGSVGYIGFEDVTCVAPGAGGSPFIAYPRGACTAAQMRPCKFVVAQLFVG